MGLQQNRVLLQPHSLVQVFILHSVTPKEFFDSDISEPQMVCNLMKLAKQLLADDLAVLINMAERLIQKYKAARWY